MKKIILFNVLLLVLCLGWKWLHFSIVYPEYTEIKIDASEVDFITFVINIVREEVLFRALPVMFIAISLLALNENSTAKTLHEQRNEKTVKKLILGFGIALVILFQGMFAISHLPDDELFRIAVLHLPPTPSMSEISYAFSAWGIPGLCYAGAFALPFRAKKRLLWKMGAGLACSIAVHLLYNLSCLSY